MRAVALALRLALALIGAAVSASAETPQVDYLLQCQGCHRADGGGTPDSVPHLRDFVGRFLTVPGGREYLIRVPGSAQSPLDDAELAAVLNWMIERFGPAEVSAAYTPFSAEEVTRVRRPPLTDVESVRSDLVSRMSATQAPPAD
jgi:mono/diheme cytochrome c family protein